MKKIIHIRGENNYIKYKSDYLSTGELDPQFWVDQNITKTLSKDKVLRKKNPHGKERGITHSEQQQAIFFGFKQVILLWNEAFNVDYFLFRQKLRDISIKSIKDVKFFDKIIYNDTEYVSFIKNNTLDDFVMFSQDDDDIILPSIHDIQINPGLNIYLWPTIDFENPYTKIRYINQRNKKVKSSHYCNYYQNNNDNQYLSLHDLLNHQIVYTSIRDNIYSATYHDSSFNLYFRHPSSLTYLSWIRKWCFADIGGSRRYNNLLSLEEQKLLVKLHIKSIINVMELICKRECHLPILNNVLELYKELI